MAGKGTGSRNSVGSVTTVEMDLRGLDGVRALLSGLPCRLPHPAGTLRIMANTFPALPHGVTIRGKKRSEFAPFLTI